MRERERDGDEVEFKEQLPHDHCFIEYAERPACPQRPLNGESVQRISHDGPQRNTGGDHHTWKGKGHQLIHKGRLKNSMHTL